MCLLKISSRVCPSVISVKSACILVGSIGKDPKMVVKDNIPAEMYPECVIASWDALILLLHAENIE